MYVQRQIENAIREAMEAFPAVLITGPRQVGKSTALKALYPKIPYFTLDDKVILSALEEDAAGFLRLQETPLILDEIQRAPDSFVSMKYQIDQDRKPGMYLLTGSQRYNLMANVSESLAGRIGILSMLGLSLREIVGDANADPFLPTGDSLKKRRLASELTVEQLWETIHRGSMPELYANKRMRWDAFYAAYVDTYIERDVRQILKIGDTLTFAQFMTALAARTGSLLNMHDVAKDVGIDDKTVKSWLSVLQASGIIYLLQPFSLNVEKRLIKAPKLYFTDTGLVCYLCRWLTPETLRNGAMAGGIFETFVVSEILKSYYHAGKEPNLYFFRNTDGQEVDLLFYQDGTLFPIEIKKTASPNAKDIRTFQTLHTFFPNLSIEEGGVICTYHALMPLEKGRWIIPAQLL